MVIAARHLRLNPKLAALALAALAAAAAGQGSAPEAQPPASQPASRPAHADLLWRSEIPPGEVQELTDFLKEYLPDSWEELQRLEKEEPSQARRLFHRLYRLWWGVRQYPPEVRKAAVASSSYRLNQSTYPILREIRRSDSPAEKAELTRRLREVLVQHFEQDLVVKDYRLKFLAQRLGELKATVQQRRTSRPELIEQRLTELLQPRGQSRPATTAPGPYRRPVRPMERSPEREAAVIEFIKENAPEMFKQLERLRKEDPQQAQQLLARAAWLWRRVRGLPENVRAAVLARQRLNVDIGRTVQRIRSSQQSAAKIRLIGELRELLAKQFGHDQVVLEYRLGELSRELEALRGELATRRHRGEQIIQEWLERLLSPPLATRPAEAPAAAKAP